MAAATAVDVDTKVKKKPTSTTKKATVAEPEKDPRSFGWCKDCSRERPLGSGNLVLNDHNEFSAGYAQRCPGSGQPAGVAPEQDTDDTITEMAYHSAGGSSTQTLWGS